MTRTPITNTGATGESFVGACLGALFIDSQFNYPGRVKQACNQ